VRSGCLFPRFAAIGESPDSEERAKDGKFPTMSDIQTDRRLLAAIRRDDPAAFEEFVHLYGGRIMGFGMRVCGEREDAEIQIPDVASLPDDDAVREEARVAVHAAIRQLAPEYRMVLLLRDIEQLSTRETATALDLNEGTVKMRLHRARLTLRKILARRLGQPGHGRGERLVSTKHECEDFRESKA